MVNIFVTNNSEDALLAEDYLIKNGIPYQAQDSEDISYFGLKVGEMIYSGFHGIAEYVNSFRPRI